MIDESIPSKREKVPCLSRLPQVTMSSNVLHPKRYLSQAILAPIDIVSRTIPCNHTMVLTLHSLLSIFSRPFSWFEGRDAGDVFLHMFLLTHIRYPHLIHIYQPAQPNNHDFLSLSATRSHRHVPHPAGICLPTQPNN